MKMRAIRFLTLLHQYRLKSRKCMQRGIEMWRSLEQVKNLVQDVENKSQRNLM
jgi:hypothetical protein